MPIPCCHHVLFRLMHLMIIQLTRMNTIITSQPFGESKLHTVRVVLHAEVIGVSVLVCWRVGVWYY